MKPARGWLQFSCSRVMARAIVPPGLRNPYTCTKQHNNDATNSELVMTRVLRGWSNLSPAETVLLLGETCDVSEPEINGQVSLIRVWV